MLPPAESTERDSWHRLHRIHREDPRQAQLAHHLVHVEHRHT